MRIVALAVLLAAGAAATLFTVPRAGHRLSDGATAPYCEPGWTLHATSAWCQRTTEMVTLHTAGRGPREHMTFDDWLCANHSCTTAQGLFTRDREGVALGYVRDKNIVAPGRSDSPVQQPGPAPGVASECPPGLFGERCEMSQHQCALRRCSNRGYCTGKVYGCACDEPYAGDCSAISCGQHGIGSGDRCECLKGWEGARCTVHSAERRCTSSGGRYSHRASKCSCPAGREPEDGKCPPKPCGPGGRPVGKDRCECSAGVFVRGQGCVKRKADAHGGIPLGRGPAGTATTAFLTLFVAFWMCGAVYAGNWWRMRYLYDRGAFETDEARKRV